MASNKRHLCLALSFAAALLLSDFALAEDSVPATVCLDKTHGQDRAMCVMVIGAIRQMLHGGKPVESYRACSPVDPHDLSDTYRIMDWIAKHPDRQGDNLPNLSAELLQQFYPCPS
jgi:hypothetical protein